MKKPEHTVGKNGCCTRCGLVPSVVGCSPDCPPGFWMTRAELALWQLASPNERRKLEAEAIRLREE